MTSPATGQPVDSASSSVERLFILPFDPDRGSPGKNTYILNQLEARPDWTVTPLDPLERRAALAGTLVSPQNYVCEVWRGGQIVGILVVQNILPHLEAEVHFVFFDGNLMGRRNLLKQWCRDVLVQFDLQRLVILIPEHVETLIRFARVKLGFRYEGESSLKGHPALDALGMENPHVWVARQGSRRERSCLRNGTWVDTVQLRLHRDEVTA